MSDRRQEILDQEHWKIVVDSNMQSISTKHFPIAYSEAAINAMDEYMKETCLQLLEYMAKNEYKCFWMEDDNGRPRFFFSRGPGYETISKEQLFENFL